MFAPLFTGARWVLECAPDGLAYFHSGELAMVIAYGDIVGVDTEEGQSGTRYASVWSMTNST